MRALRLALLAAAVAVPAFLATGASAKCVRTAERPPLYLYVEGCVADRGCVVYQDSGSIAHAQQPVCVLPVPAG